MSEIRRIGVFCGSASGSEPGYEAVAAELGTTLAGAGIGVVYGGAHVGLMGVLADAAMAAGGEVIGVIPETLLEREIAHTGLTDLVVVDGMHERKRRMYDLSDGFCALPGGFGTLDEVFEATTWTQLGIHDAGRRKPVTLLDDNGFWDPLVRFLDEAVASGFVKPANRGIIVRSSSTGAVVDDLAAASRR